MSINLIAATYKSEGRSQQDYSIYLDSHGLKGAKIGVFNNASKEFYESEEYDEELFKNAIQTLSEEGAMVIEISKFLLFIEIGIG